MNTWLSLLLLFGGLMAVFVAWDLVFCNGMRCRELMVRVFEIVPGRYRSRLPRK